MKTNQKANVTINHATGREFFQGDVKGESTTHVLVAWNGNSNGEWFARSSRKVTCSIVEE